MGFVFSEVVLRLRDEPKNSSILATLAQSNNVAAF